MALNDTRAGTGVVKFYILTIFHEDGGGGRGCHKIALLLCWNNADKNTLHPPPTTFRKIYRLKTFLGFNHGKITGLFNLLFHSISEEESTFVWKVCWLLWSLNTKYPFTCLMPLKLVSLACKVRYIKIKHLMLFHLGHDCFILWCIFC